MQAGIVVYRRGDGVLIGQWANEDTHGRLASEVVHDVPVDTWEGNWLVDIFVGDELVFRGTWNSVRFGDCLKLTWQGKLKDGAQKTYQGIGYAIDAETMAATFEPDPKADKANTTEVAVKASATH